MELLNGKPLQHLKANLVKEVMSTLVHQTQFMDNNSAIEEQFL